MYPEEIIQSEIVNGQAQNGRMEMPEMFKSISLTIFGVLLID
jgi:hypothetical protein